ncbi:hypothetical protein KDH_06060 [Dictyobacter sp. S3.2.2.5]|uniref:Uncharacterized protein n=1 Tax=Dictyobacter halimunensis TaxID=3026934 RepID=A0ABQ6FL47_9CHLR|nr:hypothetical protein KDH_06060 [Dictyobacter sp. S3.2.2.5]
MDGSGVMNIISPVGGTGITITGCLRSIITIIIQKVLVAQAVITHHRVAQAVITHHRVAQAVITHHLAAQAIITHHRAAQVEWVGQVE